MVSTGGERVSGDQDICTLDQLRDVLPTHAGSGDMKVLDRLDEHCRRFVELSTFVVIASRNSAGKMDVSPKGDPPGFVRIVDERTLAVPERPGNRRCDTFTNVLQVPDVAMIFFVPGEDLTLRVMGRASITSDPALLRTMAVQTREPVVALRVDVDEAFIHCGKAPKRARLWDPDAQVAKGTFPRMGEMLHDQITGKYQKDMEVTRSEMGDITDTDYRDNVY
jgi:PPOX class probable FMN-dependent enzyme